MDAAYEPSLLVSADTRAIHPLIYSKNQRRVHSSYAVQENCLPAVRQGTNAENNEVRGIPAWTSWQGSP